MIFFRCAEWVTACRRSDLDDVFKKKGAQTLYARYYVCSIHFRSEDFMNSRNKSSG